MSAILERRFTCLDAMVLVALTAVAFLIMRSDWQGNVATIVATQPSTGWTARAVVGRVPFAVAIWAPCVTCWSLGVLMLALRQPRRKLRRALLQPGPAACMCVASSLLAGFARIAADFAWWFVSGGWNARNVATGQVYKMLSSFEWGFHHWSPDLTRHPGMLIVVAWGLLGLAGRFRLERSWIDRAGRIIGAFWIAYTPCIWWIHHVLSDRPSWFSAPPIIYY
jgi:hypothetical protein